MQLNLHSIAHQVTALGPGKRAVLWLAGCPLRCKGCITPQLWSQDSGAAVDVEVLADYLLSQPGPTDGVTLTGGEPFAQAEASAYLLQRLCAQRPQWNVLVFSGYPLRYLKTHITGAVDLLQRTDLLIDGPYGEKQISSRPLLASKNQTMRVLSAAGKKMEKMINNKNAPLFNLGLGSGQTWLIGVGRDRDRSEVHTGLGIQVSRS